MPKKKTSQKLIIFFCRIDVYSKSKESKYLSKNHPKISSVQFPNLPFPPDLIKGQKGTWSCSWLMKGAGGTCQPRNKVSWETAPLETVDEQDLYTNFWRNSTWGWLDFPVFFEVSKKYLLRAYLDKSRKASFKNKKDDLWADSHRPSKISSKDHAWKDLWPNFKSANPFLKTLENIKCQLPPISHLQSCRVHMGDLKATPNGALWKQHKVTNLKAVWNR